MGSSADVYYRGACSTTTYKKRILIFWKQKHSLKMMCKVDGLIKGGLKYIKNNSANNIDSSNVLRRLVDEFNVLNNKFEKLEMIETLVKQKEYRLACHFIDKKLCIKSRWCGLICPKRDIGYSFGFGFGFGNKQNSSWDSDSSVNNRQDVELIDAIIDLIGFCGWKSNDKKNDTTDVIESSSEEGDTDSDIDIQNNNNTHNNNNNNNSNNENSAKNRIKVNKDDQEAFDISHLCCRSIMKLIKCAAFDEINDISNYLTFVSQLYLKNSNDECLKQVSNEFADCLAKRSKLVEQTHLEIHSNTFADIKHICLSQAPYDAKVKLIKQIQKIISNEANNCRSKKKETQIQNLVKMLCEWQNCELIKNTTYDSIGIYMEVIINNFITGLFKNCIDIQWPWCIETIKSSYNIQVLNHNSNSSSNNSNSNDTNVMRNKCHLSLSLVHGYVRKCAIKNGFKYDFSDIASIIHKYYHVTGLIKSLFVKPKLRKIVNKFDAKHNFNDTFLVINLLKHYDAFNLISKFLQTEVLSTENNKCFQKLNHDQLYAILEHLVITETNVNLQKKLLSKFSEMYLTCVKQQSRRQLLLIDTLLNCQSLKHRSFMLKNDFVQNILKQRLNYLENKVESIQPKFTWKMENVYLNNVKQCSLQMKQFLLGETQSYQTQKFKSVAKAKQWATNKKKIFSDYLTFTPMGRGARSYVLVEKTRYHFDKASKEYNQYNVIKALVNQE